MIFGDDGARDGPGGFGLRAPGALRLAALFSIAVATASCTLLRGDGSAGAPDAAPTAAREAATRDALAILERTSSYLASLHAFQFVADVRYDAVQPTGQRIEFGSERRVALRRPDRLRTDVEHWDGVTEILVYDGRQLAAAAPALNVYAASPQRGPVGAALARVQQELGVPAPLAELVDTDLYAKLRPVIESGARVGRVRVDGAACEQLAFRTAGLDFQLYVETGDSPLPLRLVIDYREEPGRPQFRATLRDWEVDPDLPETLFRFAPPIGAQRVPFGELMDLLESQGYAPVAAGSGS